MKKNVFLALTMSVMMLGAAIPVSAESYSRSINDIGFSVYTNIASANANAGTVSGSRNLEVSVSATYYYVNVNTMKTGTIKKSASGTQVATLTIYAPTNCRSVKITATHTAESGNERWTGTTSEIR